MSEADPRLINRYIIPVLPTEKFSNLSSLSLGWDGPNMDEVASPPVAKVAERSLAVIGTLTSLEPLRIRAGVDVGWRCQWLIDHEMLWANLGRLKRLRTLALCRDTYFCQSWRAIWNLTTGTGTMNTKMTPASHKATWGKSESVLIRTVCLTKRKHTLRYCRLWSGSAADNGRWGSRTRGMDLAELQLR